MPKNITFHAFRLELSATKESKLYTILIHFRVQWLIATFNLLQKCESFFVFLSAVIPIAQNCIHLWLIFFREHCFAFLKRNGRGCLPKEVCRKERNASIALGQSRKLEAVEQC